MKHLRQILIYCNMATVLTALPQIIRRPSYIHLSKHFQCIRLKQRGSRILARECQHKPAETLRRATLYISSAHRFSPSSANDQGFGITSFHIDKNGKMCLFTWADGFTAEFHSVWLRHNCHCDICRHGNGQRLLSPDTIPTGIRIENVTIKDDVVEVLWKGEENHKGILPVKFLRKYNYNSETHLKRRDAVKCSRAEKIQTVTYEGINNSSEEYLKWLQQINEDGLSLVQGVPLEEEMVLKVAQLIAPVWTTIYGDDFDVITTKDPINVAYSSIPLSLHMDLVYFESPPGLQFLHCIRFDDCIEGGFSIFVDCFAVAEKFRCNYPDLFHVLTTVPASFQKVHYDRDLPVHIVNQKPHIKLNHKGDIVAVYWAPPFEAPLAVDSEDVERYYMAYEMFAKSIENSLMLKYRLKPRELVVFNNTRMLHGRTGFEPNGGMRHIRGCYVNIDMFKSKVQVTTNLHGDGHLAKRVGNQCWF